MMGRRVVSSSVLLLLALVTPVGRAQNNNKPVQSQTFILDSYQDCNGPVREIYKQTVTVKGHGAIQEQQAPTSCTLTLRFASNFARTQVLLQVAAANIKDCDVKLVMYDGDPGQGTLRGFDCNTPLKPNERDFVTTGDTVSFMLTRQNVFSSQYDIEILVTPLDGGMRPDNEGEYGGTWGFHREKLENDVAIGIVGAAFLLVIIVFVIVVIACYRRYLGKNKPWEQHQLSTFRSPQSIYETKSKMSDTSSDVWTSNMSRARMEPPRRRTEPNGTRMSHPSEDEDSVFDDASDIAPKKYLMEQDRRQERHRERQREREREGERNRGRGRDFGSQNSSYVLADDDHPQDTFVERVIQPRVRPSRHHKPPSYNEAINESETEKSDFDDDDESEDDVDKNDSPEEESEEEEEASSEQEEEEEEEEDGNTAAPKPAPRPRTQQAPTQNPVPLQPGMPPHPAYPGYPPMGYMGGYPMGPGQFVPVMAAPPGQPFQPAPMGPGHPPPRYPGHPQARNVRPTDPPIYSYLVQRGYTPLDRDRDSPATGHDTTSHSQTSQDSSDRSALASGVDYMRR